jgi:hypothetical protein
MSGMLGSQELISTLASEDSDSMANVVTYTSRKLLRHEVDGYPVEGGVNARLSYALFHLHTTVRNS